jgi:putative hemolysin
LIRLGLLVLMVGAASAASATADPEAAGVDTVGLRLFACALLIMASATFSASETSLFSLQPIDRNALTEPGRGRVSRLLADPRRTLASLLIGNETINVALGTVSAGILLTLAPTMPWLNVVIVTPMILIFGEVLPKVIAFRYNRTVAPAIAPVIWGVSVATTPLRVVISAVADAALRVTGGSVATRAAAMREEQLRMLVDQGHATGAILPMEQEIIHRVFDFGDLSVNRLMTPRPDIFTLRVNTPWADLIEHIRQSGYSRIPMWHANNDDIVGVLLAKKLLQLRLDVELGKRGTPNVREIRALLHPAHFVPTTKRADQMLAEFKADKMHMAVVVDEHGSVAGLVTLDDLLAELVGELLDEGDEAETEVEQLAPDVYSVAAWMDIEDFGDRFGVELPEGDYNTLGGFLMSLSGEVPEKGDELEWEGMGFTVSGIERRRITEVCVRTNHRAVGDESGDPRGNGTNGTNGSRT